MALNTKLEIQEELTRRMEAGIAKHPEMSTKRFNLLANQVLFEVASEILEQIVTDAKANQLTDAERTALRSIVPINSRPKF